MFPWSMNTHGRFEEITFESEALRHNPLGDPYRRPLWVYLPPGYDNEPARRYPPSIKYKASQASSICGVIAHRLERTFLS